MPQALRLMNSQEMNRGSRVIARLSQIHKEPATIVEQLYLATLTRRPTSDERQIALKHIQSQPDATRALGDIAWALLNCTEFVTNH